MSSIEGMYIFASGSIDDPAAVENGGIVILETGRVMGGDSAMAYLGTYEFAQGRFGARVRSWKWNVAYDGENVFNMSGEIDHHAIFEGERRADDVMVGHLFSEDKPEAKLPAYLRKITDLP